MADNTVINTGSGGDTIATDDIGGVKYQRVKVTWGVDGTATDTSATNPLPVATYGVLLTSASQAIAAAGTGTCGPLTIAQGNNVTVIVKNTVAASAWAGAPVLVFEQSDDGTQWGALVMQRADTGQSLSAWTLGANAANTELIFNGALQGTSQVRVRCTTGPTTNGLTIIIQPGGSPFTPVTTALVNPAATLFHNKVTLTTPGTRVQFGAQACTSVTVRASRQNSAALYLGNSGVTSSNGHELWSGDVATLALTNTNLLWIDGAFGTDYVTWLAV